MRGIIEGFYGLPWTWQERLEVAELLAGAGMDTYVYAPKDDPLHRERWREPYPPEVVDRFAELVAARTLRVGFTVSPGLSMDLDDASRQTRVTARSVTSSRVSRSPSRCAATPSSTSARAPTTSGSPPRRSSRRPPSCSRPRRAPRRRPRVTTRCGAAR